jgi:hypothetical protein
MLITTRSIFFDMTYPPEESGRPTGLTAADKEITVLQQTPFLILPASAFSARVVSISWQSARLGTATVSIVPRE